MSRLPEDEGSPLYDAFINVESEEPGGDVSPFASLHPKGGKP
jgi:hypothetical protein